MTMRVSSSCEQDFIDTTRTKVAQAAFVGYVLEITVRRRPTYRFSPEGLKGKTSLLANHRMAKPCDNL